MDTPIGRLPAQVDLDLSGISLAPGALDEVLAVNIEDWRAEVRLIREHFESFGDKLPQGLWDELAQLDQRLSS